MTKLRIEKLTEANFADYESLTGCQKDGGCYCAFWHQKWSSMDGWTQRQKEAPELNRQTVWDKVKSGFHVGVLVYQDGKLVAWVSVGPLTDFYWTWRRVAQVGDESKTVAGITCIAMAPEFRGKGLQSVLLTELLAYGKTQGWTAIEGYPFDQSAREKHKEHVLWPGLTKGYVEAGFEKLGAHWLNHPDWARSVFRAPVV